VRMNRCEPTSGTSQPALQRMGFKSASASGRLWLKTGVGYKTSSLIKSAFEKYVGIKCRAEGLEHLPTSSVQPTVRLTCRNSLRNRSQGESSSHRQAHAVANLTKHTNARSLPVLRPRERGCMTQSMQLCLNHRSRKPSHGIARSYQCTWLKVYGTDATALATFSTLTHHAPAENIRSAVILGAQSQESSASC